MSDLTVVHAILTSETDQNGTREETIFSTYVPEPFRLTTGLQYVMQCKELISIVYESKDQFLGVWESKDGPKQFWYTSDGRLIDVDRLDVDPFDIKRVHREPDTIYLLKRDGAYANNNCFMSRDAAVKAASERGGMVIPFKEVMDD